jgi:hypothetical protein
MDHGIAFGNDEFLPLTDSLASRIRWRTCDYASLFSAELDLMIMASRSAGAANPSAGLSGAAHEFHSAIRLLKRSCEPAPASEPRDIHRRNASTSQES